MAYDISDARGITFHRRYLSAERIATQSNDAIPHIVEWITQRHDRSFRETLEAERTVFTAKAIPFALPATHSWLAIPAPEMAEIARVVQIADLPADYLESCVGEYRIASFLRSGRLVRLTLHRPGMLLSQELFLVQVGGDSHYLANGTTPPRLATYQSALAITRDSVLEYVQFHYQVVDSSRNYHWLGSRQDFLYFLVEKRRFRFQEASERINSEVGWSVQAPLIEVVSDSFRVRVDAISHGAIYRLIVEVRLDGSVRLINEKELALLPPPDASFQMAAPNNVGVHIESVPGDLADVLGALRLSSTGVSLANVLERYPARVITLPGPRSAFVFDEGANMLIRTKNVGARSRPGWEVVSLAFAIRQREHLIIGFTLPDAGADVTAYAAIGHAKNLDCLVYALRVASELRRTDFEGDALAYIRESGLDQLFAAVERGASDPELFDIYASN